MNFKGQMIVIVAVIIMILLFGRVPKAQDLAWGPIKQDWTDYLYQEIYSKEWSPLIISPCVTIELRECVAQTLSIIAKKESNFNPKARYRESFEDSDGHKVISMGLFQLSVESANQKAYNCQIKRKHDLYDPYINMSCAVSIANFWLNKDYVFFTDSMVRARSKQKGFSRYWSPARPSSKSFKEVSEYISQF